MSHRRLAAIIATALLAVSCGAANGGDPVQSALDALIDGGVPGGVVLVSGPDGNTLAVSGMAEVATGEAMTADHSFALGGLSHTYVSATMLQLHERGELELGANLEELLPGTLDYGWDIALYDLLQHTSGIPDYAAIGTDDGSRGTVISGCIAGDGCTHDRDATIDFVAADRPDFGPGEGWGWSNTNTVIAAAGLEVATGMSWQDAVDQTVLSPLELTETRFTALGAERLATGHTDLDDDGVLDPTTALLPVGAGADGALVATPADVMGFFRPLLRGDLLDPAAQVALIATAPTSFGHEDYGLGVSFIFGADAPQIGATGETLGYSLFVEHNRDTDVTTVILLNGSEGAIDAQAWGDLLAASTGIEGRVVESRVGQGPGQLRFYCTINLSELE